MKRLPWAALAPIAVILLVFVSCGGGGTTENPTPIILNIFPSSIVAGSDDFTLFISGTSFISGSSGVSFAYWNGSPRSTNFNANTGELSVSISRADIAIPGPAQVTVVNPEPGGGPASSARTFTIRPLQAGAPTISSFAPPKATAGGQAFTLTVNGTNFVAGDFIVWNPGQRVTTFVSSTELTAEIDQFNIADAGFASISVGTANPAIASLSVTFPITGSSNPKPMLTSLNPVGAKAGSIDLEVRIQGSGFVSSSTAEWNAVPLATAFISGSQIVAVIPAANLAATGTADITVTNSAPGGGTSGSKPFKVN